MQRARGARPVGRRDRPEEAASRLAEEHGQPAEAASHKSSSVKSKRAVKASSSK